jgi:protein required for attachment to host cells
MKNKDVWALVMSSTQARILSGIAKGETSGEPELVLHCEHKDLREIMSDKPGRSFSSVGMGRSAMEYASDPIKDAKIGFAKQAVALLQQHFVNHDFTRFAIFASPEMLGILRDSLTPDLTRALIAEVPKNLLHEPAQRLRQIVTEHVFAR